MLDRVLALLNSRRGPAWLGGLAALLSLPALGNGFQLDDHWLRARSLSRALAEPAWLWTWSRAQLLDERSRGYWAWWSSPRLAVNFFRPLSSLLHWLEFQCWPDTPALMLLVNIAIYALIAWLAASVYRQLELSLEVASLAGLMFAVDEAHAGSVGWIAARNTLLATLWSLSALRLQIAARGSRSRWLQLGSAGMVALALLSGEAGVWSLSYLLAYTLVWEEGRLAQRIVRIAPQLAVAAAWAALYIGAGHGMRGAAWYRELSDPFGALAEGLLDLPLWMTGLFGPSLITASVWVTARPRGSSHCRSHCWRSLTCCRCCRGRRSRFASLRSRYVWGCVHCADGARGPDHDQR